MRKTMSNARRTASASGLFLAQRNLRPRVLLLIALALLGLTALQAPAALAQSDDLTISKTVDNATPAPGAQVTYTITVTGRVDPFGGASVIDTLPAGVTGDIANAVCTPLLPTTTCEINPANPPEADTIAILHSTAENLVASASISLTVTVSDVPGTIIVNEACTHMNLTALAPSSNRTLSGVRPATGVLAAQQAPTVCDSVTVTTTDPTPTATTPPTATSTTVPTATATTAPTATSTLEPSVTPTSPAATSTATTTATVAPSATTPPTATATAPAATPVVVATATNAPKAPLPPKTTTTTKVSQLPNTGAGSTSDSTTLPWLLALAGIAGLVGMASLAIRRRR
jgi:uncharacterized repeat protein (TIGR01451 family)